MFSLYTFGYFLLSLIVTSIVISIRWAVTRNLPRLGCASVIIMLVIILVSGFFAAVPTPGTIEIAEMKTSQLSIVAKTYSHFQKDHSVEVLVSITSLLATVASASPTPNETRITAGVTPVGTPGVAIQEAFGPNYNTFAVAQLSGSGAFEIDPQKQREQSLNQRDAVTFTWAVFPKVAGEQTLIIEVTGLWVPKSGGNPEERPLGRLEWKVNVEEPIFSTGEIHLSDIVMLILGSALNVQWIWGLVQQARKKGKEKQEASSQRSAQSPPT